MWYFCFTGVGYCSLINYFWFVVNSVVSQPTPNYDYWQMVIYVNYENGRIYVWLADALWKYRYCQSVSLLCVCVCVCVCVCACARARVTGGLSYRRKEPVRYKYVKWILSVIVLVSFYVVKILASVDYYVPFKVMRSVNITFIHIKWIDFVSFRHTTYITYYCLP
jgi:hypothetical protein